MPEEVSASSDKKPQAQCTNIAAIHFFKQRPLLMAIFLCGLYLTTIWTVNITTRYGLSFLINLVCYLMILAGIALFNVWKRQAGIRRNKLAVVGWVLLLMLILGSMTIRKGTAIYVAHDYLVPNGNYGGTKMNFYYSVISSLGVRETNPFGRGTWQGYTYPNVGFVADGVFTDFYENGVKMHEGYLLNARPVGTYYRWYDTGRINLIAVFSYGKPNGHVCVWNEDGTKWSEGNFTNGKPSKDWVYYSVENPDGIKEPYDFCKVLHLEDETDKRYKWLAHLFGIKITSTGGGVSMPWTELSGNPDSELRREIAGSEQERGNQKS